MQNLQNLQNFAVHLYTQVRVKVIGVQAETMKQAMEKTDVEVNFHDLLNTHLRGISNHDLGNGLMVEDAEWAESCTDFFLVDPLLENGEVDYEKSCWFGPDQLPLVDGKSTEEQKAKNSDLADQFMQELLESVETLAGIAEEHGARTLADLMYLQLAIMKGSVIDHYPDESKVLDIASYLPSGEQWAKYIKVEHIAQAELSSADGNKLMPAISAMFRGASVENVVVDAEFGNVTSTVNGLKNVDCGFIEDYSVTN